MSTAVHVEKNAQRVATIEEKSEKLTQLARSQIALKRLLKRNAKMQNANMHTPRDQKLKYPLLIVQCSRPAKVKYLARDKEGREIRV